MKQVKINSIKDSITKNINQETITKKAFKDIKDSIEKSCRILEKKLMDFKDTYIHEYYTWSIEQIAKDLEEKMKLNGKPYMKFDYYLQKERMEIYDFDLQIKSLSRQLSFKSLTTLSYIKEGENNYDKKFLSLITKLVDNKFNVSYNTKVESMGNATENSFQFCLINEWEFKQIHARVIYANGLVNAPHFRFIITEKKLTQKDIDNKQYLETKKRVK